jgi:hypothetical protein
VSQPENFVASSFSSATSTPVNQTFQWQATPTNNNTSNPGATLNLLYGLGATTPAQTGLRIGPKGIVGFAPGQTFPGAVTSVGISAPASDFTVSGSPITSAGTLGLKWNIAPTSGNAPNAIVKREADGSFAAGPISVLNTVSAAVAVTATDSSDSGYGVFAVGGAAGVYGYGNTGVLASGQQYGVSGRGNIALNGIGNGSGSYGVYSFGDAAGVFAEGNQYAVYGSSIGYGVWGESEGLDGVHGVAHGGGAGVSAWSDGGSDGLLAGVSDGGAGGYAAFFVGDVDVDGNLSKAAGSFKIDHPLDPANKYLYHSFVESPDMMNIYNGNVTLDGNGEAFVPLPEWFQTLNRDFRYQLTCLDGFAPIYVAQRVQGNRFKIAGGRPGMEVSWQVTGVRQDVWRSSGEEHRLGPPSGDHEASEGTTASTSAAAASLYVS